MRALVFRLCSRLSECWRHLNVSHFSRLRSSSPTALPESERRRKTAELSNNRICVERFIDIRRDSLRSLRLARRSKWLSTGELSLLARISLKRRTGALHSSSSSAQQTLVLCCSFTDRKPPCAILPSTQEIG